MAANTFRQLGLRAVKAIPRYSVSLGHHNTTLSYHIHSMKASHSVFRSYYTIPGRFPPTSADPEGHFGGKSQRDSGERSRPTNTHGIGRDQMDYDVLITDVNHETLETTIAEKLGLPYLSEATEADARDEVIVCIGCIYGQRFRAIVPFVVGREGEARWVFFVLDSCAPSTYLSAQTSKLFGIREGHPTLVTIGGRPKEVRMSPPNSRFGDINLLGADFCNLHNVSLMYDYLDYKVKMVFGGRWDLSTRYKR
ncbi:hypothetical protein C7212DRAFT_315168 [Tuber magnatum]|uniref:Uncharacterized protein n=1 Tax=Tuber magnatum TaxID=42249 RepID=A0A317SS68_9PEZI|nr:hypothetical protein C7212DRAFT_315168 [Tuber magnatum]